MNQEEESDVLKQQYSLRFCPLGSYRERVWQILCADFFQAHIPRKASVLDLGAGWGEFINNIQAEKKFAMDLNPETAERLRDGVVFCHQDCSKGWPFTSNSLDVVFTSNFLEHLPDKSALRATVCEAARCVKENGKIICLGPNIRYLHGAYWDFWDHEIPLTENSLCELIRMYGFVIDLCVPRFLPFSMSAGKTPPLVFVKLYIRMPIVWRLVGKQFLVIGRKK